LPRIGIIGGSGLEKLNLFSDLNKIAVPTRYGDPSTPFITGTAGNCQVFILSRHGRDHSITPGRVNNRANIDAFRQLGCDAIITTTACGSLREDIHRGDLVIADQFIDFTRHRTATFIDHFEDGRVVHPSMADPFSEPLRRMLIAGCRDLQLRHHERGTIITIEGPRFSTRAESRMFRALGADVINMSIAPEAALASEAGIPYATVALVTDYDVWKHDEEPVSVELVFSAFRENVPRVTGLLMHLLQSF
jgi:5'-methylthioadenosine phosphorylase